MQEGEQQKTRTLLMGVGYMIYDGILKKRKRGEGGNGGRQKEMRMKEETSDFC